VTEAHPNLLTQVIVTLMKGVLERENAAPVWQGLLSHQARVRDHVAVLGLELVLDDSEGFAFLRQKEQAQLDTEQGAEMPRLVPRRQLGFWLSLMLALLRKKLAEHDAKGGDTRLIVSATDIQEMIRLFLPGSANEARLKEQVDRDITRVAEMGFLRPMKGSENAFEVRRILRSFVDAQWLGQLNERLASYRTHSQEVLKSSGTGHG
jgi:hypothetical protein